jgi:hypothetical protein
MFSNCMQLCMLNENKPVDVMVNKCADRIVCNFMLFIDKPVDVMVNKCVDPIVCNFYAIYR